MRRNVFFTQRSGLIVLSVTLVMCYLIINVTSSIAVAASMPELSDTAPVRIVEGPVLLHANAVGEWGGHTFSYVLGGEKYVFWSGMLNEPGKKSRTLLIGQYPKSGVDKPPVVTSISIDAPEHASLHSASLSLRSSFPWWAAGLVLVAVGLGVSWLYARESGRFGRVRRLAPAALAQRSRASPLLDISMTSASRYVNGLKLTAQANPSTSGAS